MVLSPELRGELSNDDCLFLKKNIGNLSYALNNREVILSSGIISSRDLAKMVSEYKKLMEKILGLDITKIVTILPEEINDKLIKVSDYDYNTGFRLRDYINILRASVNYSDLKKVAKKEAEYKIFLAKFLSMSVPDIVAKLAKYKPLNNGTNANIESIHEAFGIK